MGKQETLETIWEVPDELWERVEPIILEEDPPKARGRKRAGPTADAQRIIFRLRSGCQWNRLPKELGDDSTIHRTFQRWVGDGCLAPNVGSPCGGVRRVGWRGLGMAVGRRSDGQGTFWGDLIGPNPTDRGKAGTKRSLLVDGEGGPLSIVVAGANVHDAKLLEATLDAIVVERPQPTEEEPQHLCLDKGYDNPSGRGAAARHGYREHIRRIGEEKLDASGDKRYPARRWVVERTLAWLSKCRAVLVRYDKKVANYLGVLQLACALLWFRPTVASGHFEIVTKWFHRKNKTSPIPPSPTFRRTPFR